MSDTAIELRQAEDWNVLTSRWLEVMNLNVEPEVCSPMEALNRAIQIRCIAAPSPLDLFAAHRFLLTLLYWKAEVAGGVQQVRDSLLRGEIPRVVLNAIEAEAPCFQMFDDKAPFLQDPLVRNSPKGKWKSAGSLFAEFASGTNIAHFHHGDDEKMRLCLPCATVGMLRVVPWTQAGGRELTPSVHGAPPIIAIASGANLAMTLGLNLAPLSGVAGTMQWSGRFVPRNRDAAIPYLEAFTWNPRRIHLRFPQEPSLCWRCGRTGIAAVGRIVYVKNEQTKTRKQGRRSIPFTWQDPAAFYPAGAAYTTVKSSDEARAASGRDLERLLDEAPTSAVVAANPEHQGWRLVIPCTTGRDNKTFDHRQIEFTSLSPEAIRSKLPSVVRERRPHGLDGWVEPRRPSRAGGAAHFVHAAARLLTYGDWVVLLSAAYREMHESPAAFDLLSGLLWSLGDRKVARLPSRNVAWLVLKLMATVPQSARVPHAAAVFSPLRYLPKRQIDECRKDQRRASPYPVSFPRGHRLEADLRRELDKNIRKRTPERIDWAGLCHSLDQLLD